MQTDALADFLRRRRDTTPPEAVGLPRSRRRRAAGLRREEVAALVGMSVDYYVRLEQGRGPHPSVQMLTAMARALQLSVDERDHLFRLAGHAPPERSGPARLVRPAVLRVLDRMDDLAAFVISDTGVVLAENALSRQLLGARPVASEGVEASTTWQWFTVPESRSRYPSEDHEHHGRVRVADLRATWSRRGSDPDVRALVTGLCDTSEEFAELWAHHEVAVRYRDHKRILHPAVGGIVVDCEILATPDVGQTLVLLSAVPGSEDDDKLRLVALDGAVAAG